MTQDPLIIAVLGGMAGIIISMVGAWAKGQVERFGLAESRAEQRHDGAVARDLGQVDAIATLKAKVEMMEQRQREEYAKCAELAERTARVEAFQSWAEPLLEKAVDGLQKAVAFEARFEERLITLFKGLGAITQRVERLLPQQW